MTLMTRCVYCGCKSSSGEDANKMYFDLLSETVSNAKRMGDAVGLYNAAMKYLHLARQGVVQGGNPGLMFDENEQMVKAGIQTLELMLDINYQIRDEK